MAKKRKLPAAKPRIGAIASPTAPRKKKAATAPTRVEAEIEKLKRRALAFENPAPIRIKKSEISWGISWRRIAIVVIIPKLMLTTKAVTIRIPSTKL